MAARVGLGPHLPHNLDKGVGVRTRPWLPTDLGAKLVSWTDFSSAASVTLNGSTIAGVNNRQMGTRYNFTQGTGARQPTKAAAAQNGLDAATWGAQNLYLDEPRNKSVTRGALFAALKPTAGASTVLGVSIAGGLAWDLGGTSGRARLMRQGVGSIASSSTPVPVGTWGIIAATLADTSWSFRLNGTADGSGTPGSFPTAQQARLGGYAPATSAGFLGDLGDLIITLATISADDIARVEGYLAHKWGLSSLLPAGHDYKDSAPKYTYSAATYTPGYLNFTGSNLPHWVAARARVAAATGRARIVCYGDSTTAGQAAGDIANSWPHVMAGLLGVAATTNYWSWKKGNVSDARCAATGTWGNGASNSIGGPCAATTGAGSTLTFVPDGTVDRIEVRYPVDTGLTGGFSVAIDGVGQAPISNTGAQALGIATYSVALGVHSITLTSTGAGSNQLISIRAWDSSATEVEVINAGWPGASSPEHTGTATAFDSLTALLSLAPDLVIIEAGIINNWNGGQMNTVENFSTVIAALQGIGCDIIVASSLPSDPSSYAALATQGQYVGDQIYAALAYNAPMIDVWGGLCGGTFATVAANGWGSGDKIHGSAAGYAAIAAYKATALAPGFISIKQ